MLDFKANFAKYNSLKSDTWGTSYGKHSVAASYLADEIDLNNIEFSNASKQASSSNIPDMPVLGSKAVDVYVTISFKTYKVNSVTFNMKAWGSDKINTLTIEYDVDGSGKWESTNVGISSSSGQELGTFSELSATFSTAVSAFRLVFKAGTTSSNKRIGVQSVLIDYTAKASGGGSTEPTHECTSQCETCGKCTNQECQEKACQPKCECSGDPGGDTGKVWKLVTDENTLSAGDQIVIVDVDVTKALSINQADKNRSAETIVKNGDGTITITGNVQILILGGEKDAFTLYAENYNDTKAGTKNNSGYLYAAGTQTSGANYLKSEPELDNNNYGKWKITIDSKGVASITSVGNTKAGVMQLNNTVFACYNKANYTQLSIFKLS